MSKGKHKQVEIAVVENGYHVWCNDTCERRVFERLTALFAWLEDNLETPLDWDEDAQ